MEKTIKINVNGVERSVPAGISLNEICEERTDANGVEYLLAIVNGKLSEMFKNVYKDSTIEFLTMRDNPGRKTYTRGLYMVLLTAITNLFGAEVRNHIRIEHSIGPGIYCEMPEYEMAPDFCENVKKEMLRIITEDKAIEKHTMNRANAVAMFEEAGMKDKVRLFRYRRASKMNVYSLEGYTDYFYGYMPMTTGCLKVFDLLPYKEGMLLLLPTKEEPKKLPKVENYDKLYQTLRDANRWGVSLGVETVGNLNDAIAKGSMEDLILVQEALQEKKLGEIAELVKKRGDVKFVMIAGPSSSGKTTFSHRLSIQLRTLGYVPHPIALDNYYRNRVETPKNPDGSYNFECLEALNVELFNQQMQALLRGEKVELPEYNFKLGKQEYKGNFLQLGAEDILVIEGIHGLNDALSYSLPQESKFKVYISALTELNVDCHNRIPTTDGRLIRRIVRDARTRGTSARETIAMWESVRAGEKQYIFPFQEQADYMFNSAMIYELAVLKQYAEPLLFGIPEDCEEYFEAKRILKFLDYFLGIPTENIPKNSIIREFIGGSCFRV